MDSPSRSPSTLVQDMAQLLEEEGMGLRTLHRGAVVQGQVMRIDPDGILISVGHKAEGFVPQREMRTLSAEEVQNLRVGDEVLACVLHLGGEEGQVILSLDQAQVDQTWLRLEQHLANGQPLEGVIAGFNRGGVVVDVRGVQGFVPLSQLAPIPRDQGDSQQVLAGRVGEKVTLQVLEVDRRRSRAILSERSVLQKKREEQKEKQLQQLQEGEVRRGKVTSVCSFGAFVDLGGIEGLIHISEMAWAPVSSPEEVAKVGDEVDVHVLRVDRESRRIALSLRRLQPEPWATVPSRYQVGQRVTGVVTKLVNFGAFARIGEDVEGLIHISALTDRPIRHPKEVVQVGDTLELRIVSIEPERRRLGLSLKPE